MTQKDVSLYYNVKVYIKISCKNIDFKSFQVYKKKLSNKRNWLHQIIIFASIFAKCSHQKYCYKSSSKNFNTNLNNHLLQWKLNISSIMWWLLISCLHPQQQFQWLMHHPQNPKWLFLKQGSNMTTNMLCALLSL